VVVGCWDSACSGLSCCCHACGCFLSWLWLFYAAMVAVMSVVVAVISYVVAVAIFVAVVDC